MRNKGLHVARCTGSRQSYLDRDPEQCQRAKPVELEGAGADVPHGAAMEIEVADIRAVGTDIGLLADHDIVD